MNNSAKIEALLYTCGEEGIEIKKISELLLVSVSEVNKQLLKLKKRLDSDPNTALTIIKNENIYKMVTKGEYSSLIKEFFQNSTETNLSKAALEVLSIIAYKQPITRVEIDEIRGLQSMGTVQTLLNRQLIKEKGRKDAVGKPILYVTTDYFLTYFNIDSISELPDIKSFEDEENKKDDREYSDINLLEIEE